MSELVSTIAAISTPPGKGGVAVIRLSGPDAFAIAARVFRPRGKTTPYELPRTAVYGDMIADGVAVDDGLAVAFPAGNSYTGEDTVELSCHGGVLITRTVLSALFAAGAVPAGPGEFTRRAYLSGRLSLSDAEAIATVLEAKSDAQLRLSASRGLLGRQIDECYREALSLVSSAEAAIDFPEEDLGEIPYEEFEARLGALCERVGALSDSYRTGRAVTEGIRTVIAGRPNVGKSSLYNLLLGEDAAIVSDVEGTTRDILERTVPLGRVLLRLYDTAGIRESCDPIERMGVERARAAIEDADLVLAVFDGSSPLTDEDRSLIAALRGAPAAIAVLNKSDLPRAICEDELTPYFGSVISLSAKSGDATPLCELVDRLFTGGELVIGSSPIVASARQHAALVRAHSALQAARDALFWGMPADMYLYDLTEALAAIGEVDGRRVSEEVVAEIFSHFCVGK